MNNDDIFKNTKNNDRASAGLTPELEVRAVAWVLGEATLAEAAELARLAAENVALADFKRHIEAVHGLVGAAARPVKDETLRLSDERRAKVLAVIGKDALAAGEERADVRGSATPRWVLAWNKWALPMAACITLCVLLGAVMFPSVGAARKVVGKKAYFHAAPQRPEPSSTLLGVNAVNGEMDASVSSSNEPMVMFNVPVSDKAARVDADHFAPASGPVSTAMPAPAFAAKPAARMEQERTVTLGGANTYSGGAIVTAGNLEYRRLEATSAEVRYRKQLRGQQQQILSADGTESAAASAPGDVGLDAVLKEEAKPEMPMFGFAEAKKDVGKNRGTTGAFGAGGGARGVSTSAVNYDQSSTLSLSVNESVAMGAKVAADADAAGDTRLFDADELKLEKAKSGSVKGNQLNLPASPAAPLPSLSFVGSISENKKALEDAKVAHQPARPAFDESLRLETATNQQAISTFSLHVSDASFRIAKAALARGEAPEAGSIRPEEFYNAFDYGDPSAVAGEPVACRIEQSAHPFLQQRNLVRIAMKVPATGRGAGQPLRLTVLLDTSGSMEREDRAAGVRSALTSLVSLLGADDRITLIGFARQPHLLADRVPGNQAAGLADLVAKTPFEGGTNLEEALKLAGNLARGQFTASAQNRIVLLTDGAANLGNDDPAQLAAMIAALRQQGIAFDACGVGADGLDDTILEALTRKGDGRYTVINSPEEADAGFAKKLAGAFRPAAENVKVQVRFNPSRVARYRLIGFEQHRLKTEDFRNDRVDAAELAAEEAAVALYQVEVLPGGDGELGEVFVRFRDAATGNMVERSWTLSYVPQPPAFVRATPSMKLAGTAAFLAEKLRGGDLAAQIRLDEFAPVVNALRTDYVHDARVQDLVTMFAQARRITGE